MNGTILQQGRFISNGGAEELRIRSDVDFMEVFNYTVAGEDQTTAVGVEYYWQKGMPVDEGIEYKKSNAANADNMTQALASGGFTLLDTSDQTPGPLVETITAISNAVIPIVTNTGVNGLSAGDVVRLIDITGAQQLGGIDFTVGLNTLSDTTFSLDNMSQIIAGTTGSWRKINFDPQFYPTRRTITKIFKGSNTFVQTSVIHGLTVGQSVRLEVPTVYGMQEINGLTGKIVSISDFFNTITLDIDSSGFSNFAYPLTADIPFSMAEVIPIGQSTTLPNSNSLADATNNISLIGMKLAAGVDSPAGSDDDVIYWIAGKSFSVSNE